MRTSITQIMNEGVLQLCTPSGRVLSEFNFNTLGLSSNQTELLSKAFIPLAGHTSLESQRQYWRSIRKFAQCRVRLGHASDLSFAKNVVAEFADFLIAEDLSASTCQSHFNTVKNLLAWGQRNYPGLFKNGISVVARKFNRDEPKPRNYLDEIQQKIVLRACYAEMKEVEARLQGGARFFSDAELLGSEKELARLIKELTVIGNGFLPTQKTLNATGNYLQRQLAKVGGLRHLNRLLWMTPEAMFPYYLAIVIQTSGNPMAIKDLSVSCIRSHPLRDDIERLVWEKPRARSEQIIDFPKGKERTAPNLVRRYANLVLNLRGHCAEGEIDRLFICLQLTPRKVAVPCMQLMHLMLDSFIKK